jgi:hypothetical protein
MSQEVWRFFMTRKMYGHSDPSPSSEYRSWHNMKRRWATPKEQANNRGALRSLRRTHRGRHRWRRAIYHHIRLASDPNVSDKEARSAANCMVLHPDCHDDPVDFYNLQGFFRTISEGSREANSRSTGEARLMFITLGAGFFQMGHHAK